MVSGLTFEEFRASTDRLNCRESYTTLTNAAKHHLLHMENLEQEAKLNDWQRDTRAKLAAEREEEEQKQALSQQQASLQLEAQKQRLRACEDHYERLHELGVDLTQHLSQKAD